MNNDFPSQSNQRPSTCNQLKSLIAIPSTKVFFHSDIFIFPMRVGIVRYVRDVIIIRRKIDEKGKKLVESKDHRAVGVQLGREFQVL